MLKILGHFYLLVGLTIAFPSLALSWSLNEEREVEPGVYVTRYAQVGAFNIWKKETRKGKTCLAISHQNGYVEPYKGTMLFEGGPQIQLTYWKGSEYQPEGVRAKVQVSFNCNKDVQWRRPGDRFGMTENDDIFEPDNSLSFGERKIKVFEYLSQMDGKSVEISGHTYRYCEIYVDRSEYDGMVDLTGIQRAGAMLSDCER